MSAQKSLVSPAIETFEDELDSHVSESLQDPEYRAAHEDTTHRTDLIHALVAMRKYRGLTQKEVAERMGVGQSTVAGFENESNDPRLSTVQRYARAVEARGVVSVQVVADCDWVKPAGKYVNSEHGRSTRVDTSGPSSEALAWAAKARRSSFGLAA